MRGLKMAHMIEETPPVAEGACRDGLAEGYRVAYLRLSSAITTFVTAHAMSLALSPRQLTQVDLDLGNTPDYQDGHVDALEMVMTDHIMPLVKTHNEVVADVDKMEAES